MTRLVFKWSSLALALASTGATARDLPNYEVPQDTPPSPRANKPLRPEATDARVAHQDAQRGLPTFVWANKKSEAPSLRTTQLARMKPDEAAREQLGKYLSLYGHESLTKAGASVTSISRDARGVSIVTFAQQVDGVEVFRQGLKVLLDANNEVVALSGNLSPHVSAATSAARVSSLRHRLTAPQAISLAYQDLTGSPLDGTLLTRANLRARDNDPYTHYQLAPYARPLAEGLVIPARAKPVFFPMARGLVPAYYLELHTARDDSRESDYYSYVVSAADGRLLLRNNLEAHADISYRVWADTTPPYTPLDGPAGGITTPHPTGTPGTVSVPPFEAPALITLRNAPFSRNDPWLPDGATETVGNNVDAYADLVEPDGYGTGDSRASVTAPGVFDRSIDFSLQPNANAEQIQAATTQLFYVNNWLHDWFYDVGFDEASGNAQHDNFGRGGLEHDALLAEAQDYGGRNNANMYTPADGASPVMQMYIYDNKDTSLQTSVPGGTPRKYKVGSATFGAQDYDINAEVVLAVSGTPARNTACTALTNAAEVAGKIALVDRDTTCSIGQQILNVQNAGAVGVIYANNVDRLMSASESNASITIPSQYITLSNGKELKAQLPGLTARLYSKRFIELDGTIDSTVVAHEWGHYISNRLIGNANGLSNNQGWAMGEGWADFTALLMMTRPEDIHVPSNARWNGAYATAGHIARGFGRPGDPTFFGVRRVTYSADMTKNALTFRHISNGQPLPTTAPIVPNAYNNAESHNAGEVWATMLWDCYVSLLRAYPFEEAQHRMKQYLVNGYKLTPATPTYLEARDALIAAASAASVEDGRRFWEAFARRGAGVGAVAPDRTSLDHAGVVESYDTTADVAVVSLSVEAVSRTCDRDNILDNGETGLLRIKLRNLGPTRTEQTVAIVTTSSPGVTLGHGGQVQVPTLDMLEETEVTLAVSLQGVTGRQLLSFTVTTRQGELSRPGDRKGTLSVGANHDETPASTATEAVESHTLPWTLEHDSHLTQLDWSILPHPTPPNHVFFGENADTTSDLRLITPPLTVGTTEPLVLEFKQAWDFDQDGGYFYDGAVIELSQDDGQTWADVGAALYNGTLVAFDENTNPLQGREAIVGRNEGFPALIDSKLDLGTAYAGKTVRLRFRIGSDYSFKATGWMLDDLRFSGITNTPFTAIHAEDGVCVPPPAPVITAGEDVSVEEHTSLTLHGSATDPEGNALTSVWKQLSGPEVTLTDANTLTPSFLAPEVNANTDLVFKLSVSNGGSTDSDTVKVTVTNVNRAPTAHAGDALTVEEGTQAQLDGTASSDPDGDALSYIWTQVEGTPVTLSGADSATPFFTAPDADAETTLRFSLVVKDGSLDSAPAFVSVTVTPNPDPEPQPQPEPPKCGCSTGAEAPLGLIGLGLLALARRRRVN
ncbi:myxosortase-dependent M36 family metallopeptidase [Cystobacter fuscus]|uniref:myxosortase-dependent M36 family metallopeptidase n=1 Tax=Cystobacter fuscus TaxID=43 RepID=UPI002B2A8009|nr:aldo/keto reductase [Cystobacter fuscus]